MHAHAYRRPDRLITTTEAQAVVQATEISNKPAAAVRRCGQTLTLDKPFSLGAEGERLTKPTNGVAVNLRVNPPEQERAALIGKLVHYNQSKAGPRHFSQFGIFLRGPIQELIGGLVGTHKLEVAFHRGLLDFRIISARWFRWPIAA